MKIFMTSFKGKINLSPLIILPDQAGNISYIWLREHNRAMNGEISS